MKTTASDSLNYSQLSIWDYMSEVSAEGKEQSVVWSSLRMDETDNTDKTQHRGHMLERILSEENFKQAKSK